jgi:phosphonopyruvate decarboxylase
MNLGALVTTSTKQPKNFYHFLFNNGVYAVTGGQPIPGSEGVSDWTELARGAGYAAVFSFDNLEDFTTGIDEVLAAEGPVFVLLSVEPEIENTPVQFRQRATRSPQQAFQEVTANLAGD